MGGALAPGFGVIAATMRLRGVRASLDSLSQQKTDLERQTQTSQARLESLNQQINQKQAALSALIGAVRTDLPPELIIALAMGMGQAIDTWLITRPPGDEELAAAVRTLMETMRRALRP